MNTMSIYQHSVCPYDNLREDAHAAKAKFTFHPIGKNEENKVTAVTTIVFQKYRLTQPSYKSLAPGQEVLVRLIGSNQAEIKVGVGISRAPGIGAAQKSGHHPLICLASFYKAVH